MDIQLAPASFKACLGRKLIVNHSRLIPSIKSGLKKYI